MEGQYKPVRGGKQGIKGRGAHPGVGERKGWGRQVCREGRGGSTERGAGQPGHLRGRSSLRRQNTASFKIISRNLQT